MAATTTSNGTRRGKIRLEKSGLLFRYCIKNENTPERRQPEDTFPFLFFFFEIAEAGFERSRSSSRVRAQSLPSFLLRSFMEIYLPMKKFFHNLIHPEYSAVTDVYVLMFLADTVDFIIIVFGFWAFGVGFYPETLGQFTLSTRERQLCSPSSRNIPRPTSPRPSQRTRCPDPSWSWF